MKQNKITFSRATRLMLALLMTTALIFPLAACKEEGDIVPGPTAKPEQPTVIVNNEAQEQKHTIVVNGNGEVIAVPDFATITIVAMGSSATSEEAAANCELVTQKVKDIAAAQGVLAKHLTTSGVTLSSNTRESDGAITGYVARDTITIVENNVTLVNGILSPIIDARITESYKVTYSLLDATAAYSDALAAAMTDAQVKAQAIATAGGVTLDGILSVSEAPMDSQLSGVAFESSSIAVDAALTVTYQIIEAQPQG